MQELIVLAMILAATAASCYALWPGTPPGVKRKPRSLVTLVRQNPEMSAVVTLALVVLAALAVMAVR